MGKSSLASIAKGYVMTLHKGTSSKLCPKDIVMHMVLPVMIGVAAFACPAVDLPFIRSLFANSIIAVSIVSALLCGLAVMVFQLRMQLTCGELAGMATGCEARLIDEMFSDVLWAVVCGFASVLFMTSSGSGESVGMVNDVLTSVSLMLVANYVMVTCMCLKRLNSAYIIVSMVWPKPSRHKS